MRLLSVNISLGCSKKQNFSSKKINQEKKVVSQKNNNDKKDLLDLYNELINVTQQIGGVSKSFGIESDIEFSKAKIQQLKDETKKAWSNAPKILEEKLNSLDLINARLDSIKARYDKIRPDDINKKQEIFFPEKPQILTNQSELNAMYVKLQSAQNTSNNSRLKSLSNSALPLAALSKSLRLLDTDDWDFKEFNKQDSMVFSKLKNNIIFKHDKEKIKKQIEDIDTRLINLRDNGYNHQDSTNLNIFYPNETGKLLALETAKLRRESLLQDIVLDDSDQYLDNPNILLMPTSTGIKLPFLIDEKNTLNEYKINEVTNANNKYILKELFPRGLNTYFIPGYPAQKGGYLNGGECLPSDPDAGVFINSYDYNEKYEYLSLLEKTLAASRGLKSFIPSVLSGEEDVKRALAHEIGHVVSYKFNKIEQSKTEQNDLLNTKISFMTGWQSLRMESKRHLNTNDLNPRETKYLTPESKANITQSIEFEMLAEDIRLALNQNTQTSSKMTGIYDQSEEGHKHYSKILNFIRAVLQDKIDPTDAFIDACV